jgi:hypothetical protein
VADLFVSKNNDWFRLYTVENLINDIRYYTSQTGPFLLGNFEKSGKNSRVNTELTLGKDDTIITVKMVDIEKTVYGLQNVNLSAFGSLNDENHPIS